MGRLSLFRREPEPESGAHTAGLPRDGRQLVETLAPKASLLGREAAEVRGAIEDTQKTASAQAGAT